MERINLGKVVPERGVDYWTQADQQAIIQTVENDINISQVNANIATLQMESGHTIEMSLNSTTYALTLSLKNKAGTVLSTQTIDLPNENALTNITYSNGILTLTKQNGETSTEDISGLISGLQLQITSSNKLSSDLVDDTNKTNKFVTLQEKNDWSAKYTKPSGGIPKTDLSSDVQTSLGKADKAVQKEHKTGSQVEYKVLSDNNYTDAEKEKLASLENYDDTDITERVEDIEEEQETQNEDIEKLQDKVANQQKILSQMPKVTGEGTEFTMENTIEAEFVEFLPGGNTEQETTEGRQLLQLKASQDNKTTNNINQRLYVDTGKVVLNGTPSTTFNLLLAEITLAAGTYTMSGCPAGGSWNDSYGLLLISGSTSFADYGNGKTFTIEEETAFQVMVRASSSYTFSNFTFYPQIEPGSTIHSYEKYTGGIASPNVDYPQERYSAGANGSITEKIVNMNWFDGVIEEGSLNSGQNATASTSLIRSKNYSAVKPNTQYAFSVNGTLNKVVMNYYDINKNWINTGAASGELCDTGIFTTPENAHYVRFRCYAADYNLFLSGNIQIELGSTATPYTEHKEQTYTIPVQQEMRDIKDSNGNVIAKDEFIEKNGIKYERHNVARVVFDGTETWQYDSTYKYFRCPTYVFDKEPKVGQEPQYSNYFTITNDWGSTFRDQTDVNMMYHLTPGGYRVCIRNTNYDTPAGFANWLAEQYANGTPVYVDYILATPTDLPCTQAQIDVLESPPETYAEQTNVFSEDTVPANVKASGYLDLNSLVNAIIALGGNM